MGLTLPYTACTSLINVRTPVGRAIIWDDVIAAWQRRSEFVLTDFEKETVAEVDVQTTVQSGVPHQEILVYGEDNDIDLIVMGRHGRTGWDRFVFGSVAERVVRSSAVSVLTDRTPYPHTRRYFQRLIYALYPRRRTSC